MLHQPVHGRVMAVWNTSSTQRRQTSGALGSIHMAVLTDSPRGGEQGPILPILVSTYPHIALRSEADISPNAADLHVHALS